MEILHQLQQHLPPFALDVIRLSMWFMALVLVLVPLERLLAVHKQNIFRKSFATDLGYYFLNGILPKALLVFPVAVLARGLHALIPGSLQTWAQDLPLWGRATAAMVVGEIGFYWGHRLTHSIPFLWRFHVIHHSAEEMDWLVNTRAHPLDIVFVRLCGFVPMYALGLAQPLRGRTLDTVPLLILLVGTMWGFFIHANLKVRFGWLNMLISTPAFHHWHHTKDEHIDKNFASMLPCMDLLFGTWYMPKARWPNAYGANGAPVPGALPGQLLFPLLPQPEPSSAAPVAPAETL